MDARALIFHAIEATSAGVVDGRNSQLQPNASICIIELAAGPWTGHHDLIMTQSMAGICNTRLSPMPHLDHKALC